MRVEFFGVVGELVISHAVFLPHDRRDKGVGQKAQAARINEMKRLGYDYAVCTVALTNDTQLHIINKYGWVKLTEFTSTKTRNNVGVFGLKL